MRLVLLLMLSFLCCIPHTFAEDNEQLSAHLATYNSDGGFNVDENATMIVRDPLGRETGYNPFTKKWKNEIPEANAVSESSDDDEGQKGPADFTIHIPQGLLVGEYAIFVYGLTEARFVLEMNGTNSSGRGGTLKSRIMSPLEQHLFTDLNLILLPKIWTWVLVKPWILAH